MCEHCDAEVESLRTVVDQLLGYVKDGVAQPDSSMTPSRRIMATTNAIIRMHSEDDGRVTAEAVHAMAVEYATVVMRLLALEQMSGISTGS
jgi:hypothetical protein